VRRLRRAGILALLLAGAACRHAAPPAPLPDDWQTLVAEPSSFAALYRLTCCGHRDLILTVRSGVDTLSLTVVIPPGGTALAVWVDGEGGWLDRAKEGCRERLPRGVLPLSATASLPLEPQLTAVLLSGLLPPGSHELPEVAGWVEATTGGFTWRARVAGPPPHCTRVVVTRVGEEKPALVADLESPPRSAPGIASLARSLSLKAGSLRAELELRSWHTAEAPSLPPWLSAPVCGVRQ
jgi:hypothetical protein